MVTQLISALTIVGLNLYEPVPQPVILAQREMSLSNRQPVPVINDVFKKNILLNLHYLDHKIKPGEKINWEEVTKPFSMSFKLDPGQTFAYHDDALPEYQNRIVRTTNAHFNSQEGFLTDGYLYGDGVCHLASIIYWVSKDAGLDSLAPTNHSFAVIADVPREYGVSIYNSPLSKGSNIRQNLYITNNKEKSITFIFEYQNETLKVIAVSS